MEDIIEMIILFAPVILSVHAILCNFMLSLKAIKLKSEDYEKYELKKEKVDVITIIDISLAYFILLIIFCVEASCCTSDVVVPY